MTIQCDKNSNETREKHLDFDCILKNTDVVPLELTNVGLSIGESEGLKIGVSVGLCNNQNREMQYNAA